ncbi:MAG: hypothetical protein ACM3UZ_17065 [Acidobacteriota bacterium]
MNTSQVLSTILVVTLIIIPFVLVAQPVIAADWNYEELNKSFNKYNSSNDGSMAGYILLGLMAAAVAVLCVASTFQKKQEKRPRHTELDRIRDFDRHKPAMRH